MAKKNKEQPKQSSLSDAFTPASMMTWVISAVASYVLLFPVECFADAARTTFMHGIAGEPFVRAATDTAGWVIPEVASLFNGLTAPYDAAVNASFTGAPTSFAGAAPISMDTVSGAGDMLNAGDALFN